MLRKVFFFCLLTTLVLFSGTALADEHSYCDASIILTEAARGSTSPGGSQTPPIGGWLEVKLPDSWKDRWPSHSGSVWYRIFWRNGCKPQALRVEPLGLSIDSINMAGEVFINGDQLWRDDSLVEPLSRSWNMPRYWTLPASSISEGINVLLVNVQGSAFMRPGLGAVHLGAPRVLLGRLEELIWNSRTVYKINIVGSLLIALLFFVMWSFYRKTVIYIWFCALNISWVVFIYNVVATKTWPFSSVLSMQRANAIALMLFCFCFCNFIFRLAGRQLSKKIFYFLTIFTIASSLIVALVPIESFLFFLKFSVRSHIIIFGAACLVLISSALRRKKGENWLYGGIGFFYVAILIHDWRIAYLNLDGSLLAPYAYPITTLVIAMILGLRVARSMRRIERFNEELQLTVNKACIDLEQSLLKKHELEIVTTKLQERVELIQDIHDGFGSALVRAIALAESGREQTKSKHISTLKSLRDDLRLVIDSGRNFSRGFPQSPQAWLAPTRYQFSSLFDSIDVKSEWRIPSAWPQTPDPMVCLTLTRFLEEALSNVLKHSYASSVSVELSYPATNQLMLEIIDNGRGFDVPLFSRLQTGVGLASMRSRIERLNGLVEIHSEPGRTRIMGVVCMQSASKPT